MQIQYSARVSSESSAQNTPLSALWAYRRVFSHLALPVALASIFPAYAGTQENETARADVHAWDAGKHGEQRANEALPPAEAARALDAAETALFVVTTNADDAGNELMCTNQAASGAKPDGDCSLRDALLAAEDAGAAFITFSPSVFGATHTTAANTIVLASGLTIPAETSVTGPKPVKANGVLTPVVAIDGDSKYTVFTVGEGTTGVSIANLTIQHGSAVGANATSAGDPNGGDADGGGINNEGTLTISNCLIMNNAVKGGASIGQGTTAQGVGGAGQGGGVYNRGTLTMSGSTVSGNTATGGWGGGATIFGPGLGGYANGGGIYSAPGELLTVMHSVVTQNSVIGGEGGYETLNGNEEVCANAGLGDGGGIWAGNFSVSSSTISGNLAEGGSASLNCQPGYGFGGGVFDYYGLGTILKSTISGNTVTGTGGGADNYGTLTIEDSTIAGNQSQLAGGGLVNNLGSVLTVASSTVTGNTGRGGGGIYNDNSGKAAGLKVTNSIVAGNTNSNSTGDDCTGCGAQSGPNLISESGNIVDPQLAPLAISPPTSVLETMVPRPGSAAICAGSAPLVPAALVTDERGYPRVNLAYPGFTKAKPCLDLGAVQTHYSIQFSTNPPGIVKVEMAFSAAITLKESESPFLPAVKISLALAMGDHGALSGETQETSDGVANYTSLKVSAAGSGDRLVARLLLNARDRAPAVKISAESSIFNVHPVTKEEKQRGSGEAGEHSE